MKNERALEKLNDLVARTELQISGNNNESFDQWKRAISVALEKIFGDDSKHVKEFNGIRYTMGIMTATTPESAHRSARLAGIKRVEVLLKSLIEEVSEYGQIEDEVQATELPTFKGEYVARERIESLKNLRSDRFDFTRLVRICEELNIANANGCYITIGALVRILIDHIPPTLGFQNFSMVASSYPGKSLKDSFKHLEDGGRKISDGLIHQTIRKKESLPNYIQVNYSSPIDVLLAEIIRSTQESNA